MLQIHHYTINRTVTADSILIGLVRITGNSRTLVNLIERKLNSIIFLSFLRMFFLILAIMDCGSIFNSVHDFVIFFVELAIIYFTHQTTKNYRTFWGRFKKIKSESEFIPIETMKASRELFGEEYEELVCSFGPTTTAKLESIYKHQDGILTTYDAVNLVLFDIQYGHNAHLGFYVNYVAKIFKMNLSYKKITLLIIFILIYMTTFILVMTKN